MLVGKQVAEAANHNLSPFASSPLLWAALVVVGVAFAWRLARTRWGWAAAVALSVLASPHLFSYMLMSLLACLRRQDAKSRGPERGISTWPDKSATQEQARLAR
jgi:hypothetical protein